MQICSEHRGNTCGHYLSIPGWVERHLVVKLGLTCQLESLKVGLEEQVRGLDNKIENVEYLKCNFNQADVRTNIYICFACWLRHAFILKIDWINLKRVMINTEMWLLWLFFSPRWSPEEAHEETHCPVNLQLLHTNTLLPSPNYVHWCHQLLCPMSDIHDSSQCHQMVSEDATLCPALTWGDQTSFVTEGGGWPARVQEEVWGGVRGTLWRCLAWDNASVRWQPGRCWFGGEIFWQKYPFFLESEGLFLYTT